jgi:phytoene synthase
VAYPYARLLGKAMQYANFIRDIAEDNSLGRTYFPQQDLDRYHLQNLSYDHVKDHYCEYTQFLSLQIQRYELWQKEAERGFHFIQRKYLPPIKTASEMYTFTVKQIRKDPLIVYKKKVKPSIGRILFTVLRNIAEVQL